MEITSNILSPAMSVACGSGSASATEAEKLACFDELNIPRLVLPFCIYTGVAGRARHYFNPKRPIAVSMYSKPAGDGPFSRQCPTMSCSATIRIHPVPRRA